MENGMLKLSHAAVGAAALLLMSAGGVYAQQAPSTKPCTPAQQAARGAGPNTGNPPESQQAARGAGPNTGNPPEAQQAAACE
jgi:hypothetical protein